MNKHDSERIAGMLEALGALMVETVEESDVVVFMTCCVREKADQHLYGQASVMVSAPTPPSGRRVVAIGGCIAARGRRTVLFTGDGSFGMNLNEMATAVSQELPITIVIFDNDVLGMVRQWQTIFYDCHYSQTILDRKTDFPALAKAFGADGYAVYTMEDLKKALDVADKSQGPVLIDCHIDMDEKVLPMIPPGRSIKDMIVEG